MTGFGRPLEPRGLFKKEDILAPDDPHILIGMAANAALYKWDDECKEVARKVLAMLNESHRLAEFDHTNDVVAEGLERLAETIRTKAVGNVWVDD
jgi:hypothetical protein